MIDSRLQIHPSNLQLQPCYGLSGEPEPSVGRHVRGALEHHVNTRRAMWTRRKLEQVSRRALLAAFCLSLLGRVGKAR